MDLFIGATGKTKFPESTHMISPPAFVFARAPAIVSHRGFNRLHCYRIRRPSFERFAPMLE
jgi:hypothetical protein